jgi:23S rRNA pseudouridine2604 synthase
MSKNINDLTRLNKAISDTGCCSRREADKLIEQGLVQVNNIPAETGQKVTSGDLITVNGQQLSRTKGRVYLAFNKPIGVASTTDKKDKSNIIDYINYPERIFHIGRLDKESEGLIFLTNDGDIVNKILRAENGHEKEYIVTVNKKITNDFIKDMSNGVPILDTVTDKCYVQKLGDCTFKIILKQGLNRQIRRMCEYFGYEVIKLKRIRIMNIHLGDLPSGKWRYFTNEELNTINKLLEGSAKSV